MENLQNLTLPAARKKMIQELKQADTVWRIHGENPASIIAKDILHK
jgi:hypothetical protein